MTADCRPLTILVTGGLGFIGSNLAPELRKRGHEVWVCDLGHSEGPNYIRCDVSKYRQPERLFDEHDFDYVYHLAAEYGRWNGEKYTVYKGHKRIIDFVEDSCRTWANIIDNFIPGEVYNVGSRPEWEMDIKGYSDLILKAVGRDDSIVTYKESEPFTTRIKTMDFSKAVRDLKHDPEVSPEEGIKRTVEWMKWHYKTGD